uniref:Ileal sodium/bile acid cotransporter n=1 Tax=Phallusia mammillata TaxID=59560 RepID=A0A6F9DRM2_9ASCI|nr:ileal sodium/bile acid cotransporter [Phallusia mammillata]
MVNNSSGSTVAMTTTSGPSTLDNATNEAIQITTAVILAIIMFGLGCSVVLKSAINYMKKPKQFAAALFLQLVIMPFLGLGLSRAVQMTSAQTVGVLIMATCPGGAYSNIVAYWLDGDMDLSIVMTTASTLLALGTMPLWLFVFPLILQIDENLRVPFDQLGYALLGIVVPVLIGSVVKYQFPKKSEYITKICSVVGSIAILVMVVVFAIVKKVDYVISWQQILVVLLLPSLALVLGYVATRLPWLNFSIKARRTVAIETAMQSSAVGTSIVVRSFDISSPDFDSIFLFPVMYAAVQLFVSFFVVVCYLICKRRGCQWVRTGDDAADGADGADSAEFNGVANVAYEKDEDRTSLRKIT